MISHERKKRVISYQEKRRKIRERKDVEGDACTKGQNTNIQKGPNIQNWKIQKFN